MRSVGHWLERWWHPEQATVSLRLTPPEMQVVPPILAKEDFREQEYAWFQGGGHFPSRPKPSPMVVFPLWPGRAAPELLFARQYAASSPFPLPSRLLSVLSELRRGYS